MSGDGAQNCHGYPQTPNGGSASAVGVPELGAKAKLIIPKLAKP
jgi:hypothetical protein